MGAGHLTGPQTAPSRVGRKPVYTYYCEKRKDVDRIMQMFEPFLMERRRANAVALGCLPHLSDLAVWYDPWL